MTQDVFRQKLEESRERERAQAIQMEFEGFPCKVRVLPRIFFIQAGRMPEYLTTILIERLDGKESTIEPDKLTAAQTVKGENFKRDAVCAVLVEPPVVAEGKPPEGGYLYADLLEAAPAFVSAVFRWIMRDCPRPIQEKGDESLSVDALENFPTGDEQRTGAQSGDKGASGGGAAVGASAAHRKRTRRR